MLFADNLKKDISYGGFTWGRSSTWGSTPDGTPEFIFCFQPSSSTSANKKKLWLHYPPSTGNN